MEQTSETPETKRCLLINHSCLVTSDIFRCRGSLDSTDASKNPPKHTLSINASHFEDYKPWRRILGRKTNPTASCCHCFEDESSVADSYEIRSSIRLIVFLILAVSTIASINIPNTDLFPFQLYLTFKKTTFQSHDLPLIPNKIRKRLH